MIKDHEKVGSEVMMTLPKNIRQIGEVQEGQRIYIEDYAYTYLHQFASARNKEEQLAFLIGKKGTWENGTITLIHGAIQGRFLKRENGNAEITEETWDDFLQHKKEYFDEDELIGWVYTQPGYGVLLTSFLIKQNEEYFNKDGQALFVLDPIEKEEVFFEQIDCELVQKSGFFIYYEKNPAMHEYMLAYKVVPDAFPDIKSDHAVRHFRIKDQEKKEIVYHKKFVNMLFALSGALVVMCIIIGVGLINNFEELNRLKQSFGIVMEDYGSLKSEIEDGENSHDEKETQEVIHIPEAIPETTPEVISEAAPEIDTSLKDKDEVEALEVNIIPETYVVKPGDNLIKIANLFYSNKAMIDEIQKINKIDNPDKIYVGQKLLLP